MVLSRVVDWQSGGGVLPLFSRSVFRFDRSKRIQKLAPHLQDQDHITLMSNPCPRCPLRTCYGWLPCLGPPQVDLRMGWNWFAVCAPAFLAEVLAIGITATGCLLQDPETGPQDAIQSEWHMNRWFYFSGFQKLKIPGDVSILNFST